jgi:hypothetical protein
MNIKIFLLIIFSLVSCSSIAPYESNEVTFPPDKAHFYSAMLVIDKNEDERKFFDLNCANYGGVIESSIKKSKSKNPNKAVWTYTCELGSHENIQKMLKEIKAEYNNKKNQEINASKAKDEQEKKDSINKAKSECIDLGFKLGTDKFTDCLLELQK